MKYIHAVISDEDMELIKEAAHINRTTVSGFVRNVMVAESKIAIRADKEAKK